MPNWDFEKSDIDRNFVDGNYGKILDRAPVKAPGVFGITALAEDAALLVREATQNSWDSALEMRNELDNKGQISPQFELQYKFRTVPEDKRSEICTLLGLDHLQERAAMADFTDFELPGKCCLNKAENWPELHILELIESGAGGMFGPWEIDESRLALALLGLGSTTDNEDRGGSYGFGKTGLILSSNIRCIFAYTCFSEREDDPGVTRRMLGATYWGKHKYLDQIYQGNARFGNDKRPLENHDADKLAESLGVEVRSPENPSDIGSTIMIIDPTVEHKDIVIAAERYWWPALVNAQKDFSIAVTDYTGETIYPDPRRQKDLLPFIDSYEAALDIEDLDTSHLKKFELKKIGKFDKPGSLALITDASDEGWSKPDIESSNDQLCSLIALLREPHMIVEYYMPSRNKQLPHIRGTFIAGQQADRALRLTEPITHDSWEQTEKGKSENANLSEGRRLAKGIFKQVNAHIKNFRKSLLQELEFVTSQTLKTFDKHAQTFGRGSGRSKKPEASVRPVSILPGDELHAAGSRRVFLDDCSKFELNDNYKPNPNLDGRPEKLIVEIRYRFVESDTERKIGDDIELEIQAPLGFKALEGSVNRYLGEISLGQIIEFSYISEEFEDDISGELVVFAELEGRMRKNSGNRT